MTATELTAAGIQIEDNSMALLRAESALDWMIENTTLEINKSDSASIAALPASAKLFVIKFSELISARQNVASQSIEGLSMSFNNNDQSLQIYQLATSLLRPYMKSQVKVFPAKRRW